MQFLFSKIRLANGAAIRVLFILSAFVVLSTGCSKDESKDKKAAFSPNADNSQPAVTLAPVENGGEKSPAQTGEPKLTINSTPDEICKLFLVAIQKRERRDYENLLTRVSKRNIVAADLDLQLPGSEKATCSIADTTYNSHKKDIAMVKCVVHDIVDGKSQSFDFSWLLRKQQVGWRIAGMLIPVENGQDFLSFENTDDVAKINSMTKGESTAAVASDPGLTQLK